MKNRDRNFIESKDKNEKNIKQGLKENIFLKIGKILLYLCVFGLLIFMIIQGVEKVLDDQTMQLQRDLFVDTIKYNDETFVINEDIYSILLIGCDNNKNDKTSIFSGQSDTLALLVIDSFAKEANIINIPRDTMTDIVVPNSDGSIFMEDYTQIALQHAYGNDDANSIKLTKDAVSKLLYNVPIDNVLRVSVEGIQAINDLIGGVTLELLDDFTSLNQYTQGVKVNDYDTINMVKGDTITLTGIQAKVYVLYRDINIAGSSLGRVQRQSQYIDAYINQAVKLIKNDPLIVLDYYDEVKEYIYMDFSINDLIKLTQMVVDISLSNDLVKTIEGSSNNEGEHLEFYPDEKKLRDLVIDLFYQKATSFTE